MASRSLSPRTLHWPVTVTEMGPEARPLSISRACRAVSTVFDLYDSLKITEHVQKTAPYLEKKLDALVEKYDCFSGRRGKGFMQGLVVEGRPVGEIVGKALENGLVVISAGSNVLRLVPPLIITERDIDEMAEKLEASL